MALLITNRAIAGGHEWRTVEELGRVLAAGDFGITSLLHGETARKASVAVPETVRVLSGEPVIRERLCGLTFEIGPTTFFQTNTAQAERLFSEALDRGGFGPDDVVFDLYCGVGALSLPLAKRVRRVHGIEIVADSVDAARRNAILNDIDNVVFEVGDIRDRLAGKGERPDGVILDPPRAGVHGDILETLIALAPPRIVYVSCNPSTLARDLGVLAAGGYRVDSVLPVDMFPHTAHVECIAVLSR